MKDNWQRDYDAFLRALTDFPDWLPEDLRHLTLAELRRKWEDPEQRARLLLALEKLARAAQPVVDDAAATVRAMRADLAQVFGMVQRVREWVRQTAATISRAQRFLDVVPRFAVSYCEPWRQQIRQLHGGAFPALTSQEQQRFMLTGLAISLQREEERYLRPPLEWVSLVAGRVDIAVALLTERFPDLPNRLRDLKEPDQDQLDLQADVLLQLGDQILPDIVSRLKGISTPEACRLLELRLTEQYLATALRHDAIDKKRLRQTRDRVEGVSLDAVDEVLSEPGWMPQEEAIAVREVVNEYLRQSDRPELDGRIVDGIQEEIPSTQLEAQTGVPARTLRDRRRRFVEWCRNRLGWR